QPSLTALATLAADTDKTVAAAFEHAARSLQGHDQRAGAQSLSQTMDHLSMLTKPLSVFAAANRATRSISALERALRQIESQPSAGSLAGAEGNSPLARSNDPSGTEKGTAASSNASGGGGAGTQSASEHEATPMTANSKGSDLRISGLWNGSVMRQLFD